MQRCYPVCCAQCQGLLCGADIWYQNPVSVSCAVRSAGCWCSVPNTTGPVHSVVPILEFSAQGSAVPGVWCPIPDTVSGVMFPKQCRVSVPGSRCVPAVGTRYQCSVLCSAPNTTAPFLRLVPAVTGQFPVSIPCDGAGARHHCPVCAAGTRCQCPKPVPRSRWRYSMLMPNVTAQVPVPVPSVTARCWYPVPDVGTRFPALP